MKKNPQYRGEVVCPLFEAPGRRPGKHYFAIGENTAYIMAEVPDQLNLEALCMANLAGAEITSNKTTALLTAQEAVDVMKKASEVAYRPPTG